MGKVGLTGLGWPKSSAVRRISGRCEPHRPTVLVEEFREAFSAQPPRTPRPQPSARKLVTHGNTNGVGLPPLRSGHARLRPAGGRGCRRPLVGFLRSNPSPPLRSGKRSRPSPLERQDPNPLRGLGSWRKGKEPVGQCGLACIHGHWCVVAFGLWRMAVHGDTFFSMESSWNSGILSRI